MANAEKRIGSRNPCVPGRYSSAGSAVWLITNISAKPQGALLRAATATGGGAVGARV
jgi:hypothetical protein